MTVGEGTGPRLAEAVRSAFGARRVHLYETFGTAAVRLQDADGGHTIEFVTARRESYRRDSRKPDVEAGTLDDDLARRDFTVNALAADLAPRRASAPSSTTRAASPTSTPSSSARPSTRASPSTTTRCGWCAPRASPPSSASASTRRPSRRCTPPPTASPSCRWSASRRSSEAHGRARAVGRAGSCSTQAACSPHLVPELAALAGVEAVDGVGHKDNFAPHASRSSTTPPTAVAWLHEGDERSEDARWLRWAALLPRHRQGAHEALTCAARAGRSTGTTTSARGWCRALPPPQTAARRPARPRAAARAPPPPPARARRRGRDRQRRPPPALRRGRATWTT